MINAIFFVCFFHRWFMINAIFFVCFLVLILNSTVLLPFLFYAIFLGFLRSTIYHSRFLSMAIFFRFLITTVLCRFLLIDSADFFLTDFFTGVSIFFNFVYLYILYFL